MKRLLAAAALVLALSFPLVAGDTSSPPCVPGDTSSPPCTESLTSPLIVALALIVLGLKK